MRPMTDALHPDHLQPGDRVGPWHILQVLGQGGSARVFKVERDGHPYSMKMALRPLSDAPEELSDEEHVEAEHTYRRLAREAAALFTYATHPNLLRVHAVDFWPNPTKGYSFLITDFIDGDNWHQWRWRKPAHAGRLVDTFSGVVRTVGALHERGVYHRDLKAENILIRRADGRPFLIDFGTVRLPGALTQTLGLPEGVLHLVPPELVAYTRSEAWKRGVPFQGGVSADLYALGVLLYQALTDAHPFSPELPDKELLAAIADTPPTPPHLLNALAPRSLSDIAMRLLEKQPEARYPDTGALLQALEEAADKERHTPAWKKPLTEPDPEAFEASTEQDVSPTRDTSSNEEEPPSGSAPLAESGAREPTPRLLRGRWLIALLAVLLLLLAIGPLFRVASLSSPVAEPDASAPTSRGNPPVHPTQSPDSASSSRGTSRSSVLAAWLCAATTLGCAAAQVHPKPARCPTEATDAMFKELKLTTGSLLRALVDVKQPGTQWQVGLYREGAVIGRVTEGEGLLTEGTLLYGELWTGPGLTDEFGEAAVTGRYTTALLADGRKYPVCIALGGPEARMPRQPGDKSGTVQLPRDAPVNAVWNWR
ncbi:hypothetical protein MEBOL_002641 [Melittangium boletus DSM 14713]|uniref:Protein kinase domain-containing protein n=2 Tax=Melittangium boletus TaxID=83453 RepID=A0A250IDG3_9BACT|nr:hypothetical protein MEBOL_002641 [Melittangium boletus DSM 14713]